MKNLLYLVLAISCSSCSLFKNVTKKTSRTDITLDSSAIRVKKDSAALDIKKDTASTSSTTTMDTHTEVTEIDTSVNVPEHKGTVLVEPPTNSTRYQFDDGIVETTISKKGGKLQVDTRVKERRIPVKGKKTTTVQHLQNKTDTRAGSQHISLHQGSSDSGATVLHKQEQVKTVEKESKPSAKGIVTFVCLVLLIIFLTWRGIAFWNGGKFIPWPLFKRKNNST